jgi:hypothetical protein
MNNTKKYRALNMNEQIELQQENERLRAELAIIEQDAVGEIIESPDHDGCYVELKGNVSYYLGQKVYLHPTQIPARAELAAKIPAGMALISVAPDEALLISMAVRSNHGQIIWGHEYIGACTRLLRDQGKSYPKTCPSCGFGPCRNPEIKSAGQSA